MNLFQNIWRTKYDKIQKGRGKNMKTAKQLLRKYERNKKALGTVEVEYEKYKTKKRTKARIIKVKLEKRMNVLEMKLEEIGKKTENKINRNRDKKDWTINKLNRQIAKFEKIVEMLKLEVDVNIKDDDVSKSEYHKDEYFRWIDGYLFDDKFFKIRLIICENYKRLFVKYAVMAVGKTPLVRYKSVITMKRMPKIGEIVKMNSSNMVEKSYSLHLNNSNNISFLFPLRYFSNLERAEKWAKRKMKKNDILLDIIYEYNKVKAKYMAIIRNYRKKDNLMEIIEAKEMAEKL